MPYSEASGLLSQPFIADPSSVVRTNGVKIDWSTVAADADGVKRLPAGKALAAGAGDDGHVVRSGTEPAVGILLSDASDSQPADAASGYGLAVGGLVYENLLPDADDAAFATIKTELGGLFKFVTYADDRA